jgi:transcriptional antiterminator NusG
MNWYALYVKSGEEDNIQKVLRSRINLEELYSIVPKRRVLEKRNGIIEPHLKNLIPGYILIKTNMDGQIFDRIMNIPNIFRVLKSQADKDKENLCSIIEEEELNPLLQLIDSNGVLEKSELLINNSKIVVKSGPLVGKEGIIKKIDKHKRKAKIELSLMGEVHMIDVAIDFYFPV